MTRTFGFGRIFRAKRFSIPVLALVLPSMLFPAAPVQISRAVSETLVEPIPVESIRPVAGFAYRGILRLARPGDSNGAPSLCTITEDGRALGPAQSSRGSIETEGRGRFSHWSERTVFFSASDNSDPRTNGRAYALSSDYEAKRHTAVAVLRDTVEAYTVEAGDAPITQRRLILRNRDRSRAVTLTMKAKGRPDFTSAETMIASILKPGMSDEEKAIAIWRFLVDWRYHHHPPDGSHEVHDPAKFLGVYGYGYCDDAAHNFVSLCRIAGIQARAWNLSRRHVVAEAFFDGGWHMFDPDHEVYFRDEYGHIMSVEELAANPAVIMRTEVDPIGFPTRTLAEIYTQPNGNELSRMIPPPARHRLAPTLRPLDEVTFDFGLAALTRRVVYRHEPPPPEAGNGVLVRPVVVSEAEGELLIPVQWPYVILGGELELILKTAEIPEVALAVGEDKGEFHPLSVTSVGGRATIDLTSWFSHYKEAAYELTLRVRGTDGAPVARQVEAAQLRMVFQFAPRVLPRVQPGGTTFEFALEADGPAAADWPGIEVVHEWDVAEKR